MTTDGCVCGLNAMVPSDAPACSSSESASASARSDSTSAGSSSSVACPSVPPPMGGGMQRSSASPDSTSDAVYLRRSSSRSPSSIAAIARAISTSRPACISFALAHAVLRLGNASCTRRFAASPSSALPRTVRGSNPKFESVAGKTRCEETAVRASNTQAARKEPKSSTSSATLRSRSTAAA